MKKNPASIFGEKQAALYDRIRQILESARTSVARSVNTAQVVANWLIGREIVEEEQKGNTKAEYGVRLLEELSAELKKEFGSGYSVDNLELFRRFYREYPLLISDATPRKSESAISDALRRKFKGKSFDLENKEIPHAVRAELANESEMVRSHSIRGESWKPGLLNPNLSWTHYRTLLRVDRTEARLFYEIEAVKNNWSARELERQINSLLYERLAKSRDKTGLMKLATKGQEVQRPIDVFKDPMVIEFLGLPESPRLVESKLEGALIENLQAFLLELGKGFAFVSRQERITLDGDHFYVDMVFYHTVLKCYVLIDLKVGKLTHADLGQIQLYVNYFDEERRTEGDNPTLGLILCTDKNDAVVRYMLGKDREQKIFASRYKLYLPTEAELQDELRREVRQLSQTPAKKPSRKKI